MARYTSKVSASTPSSSPFGSASNEEILSYVCVAVIGLFVVIAKPENTATFFSHPAVKALLFVIVAAVVYADVKVGVLFGIAVTLTFVYSHVMASQVAERFYADGDAPAAGAAEAPAAGAAEAPAADAAEAPAADAAEAPAADAAEAPKAKCKTNAECDTTTKQTCVNGYCEDPAAETTTLAAETTTPAATAGDTAATAGDTAATAGDSAATAGGTAATAGDTAATAGGTTAAPDGFTNFTPEAYAAVENFAPYYH